MTRNATGWLSAVLPALIPRWSVAISVQVDDFAWRPVDGGADEALDFVVREAIIVDLQATGKEEAIREMVGSLHRAGRLADWRHGERDPGHPRT